MTTSIDHLAGRERYVTVKGMSQGAARPDFTVPVLVVIAVIALALRLAVLDRTNLDLIDHFLPWLEQIRTQGFWAAISKPFSEYGYTPFYSYAIGLADALLPAGIDGKVVIKSVSILFDYIAAGLVFSIARLHWQGGWQPVAAFAAVLFAPTVFLNGAYWGQSDIVYTSFLLACIYLLLVKSDLWAMVCFGVALAIKLQAAWLGPFILMMMLRGRIRWWLMAIPPLMYFLLAVPALLTGRPLIEVATIYLTQAGTQSLLTYAAANLHIFPHYFLFHLGWWPDAVPVIAKAAIAFTGALALLYAWKSARGRLDDEALLVAALVSVLIMPQFLPHMHNRYFFPADLFAILLATCHSGYWPVALLMQFNSFVTYISFLWHETLMASPVPSWLASLGFTNNLQWVTGLEALAGIFNFLLLVGLWRRMQSLQHHTVPTAVVK